MSVGLSHRRALVTLSPVALAWMTACRSPSPEASHGEVEGTNPVSASNGDAADAPDEAHRPSTTKIDWDTCDATHQQAVHAWLDRVCDLGDLAAPAGLPQVELEAKASPTDALSIEIPAHGDLKIQGRPLSPYQRAEGLGRQLIQVRQSAQAAGRPVPNHFSLAMGADLPRARVAETLEAIHEAGWDQGHLILGAKTSETAEAPKPPDAALAAEIAAETQSLAPDERAVSLARRLTALVEPCAPMAKVLSAVSTVPADQKCKLSSKGIAEALTACGCPDSEKKILSVLYAINLGGSEGATGVAIALTLDATAPLSPGATWGEVVAGLELGSDSVSLGVAD